MKFFFFEKHVIKCHHVFFLCVDIFMSPYYFIRLIFIFIDIVHAPREKCQVVQK